MVFWMQFKMAVPPREWRILFHYLFPSGPPTTRSFFTTRRATRESEKHKKEEGDDTAPFRSLSLCATTRRGASDHDDGEGGKTFRFVTTALSLSCALEVRRKTNVLSSSIPFQVCSLRFERNLFRCEISSRVRDYNNNDVGCTLAPIRKRCK